MTNNVHGMAYLLKLFMPFRNTCNGSKLFLRDCLTHLSEIDIILVPASRSVGINFSLLLLLFARCGVKHVTWECCNKHYIKASLLMI